MHTWDDSAVNLAIDALNGLNIIVGGTIDSMFLVNKPAGRAFWHGAAGCIVPGVARRRLGCLFHGVVAAAVGTEYETAAAIQARDTHGDIGSCRLVGSGLPLSINKQALD